MKLSSFGFGPISGQTFWAPNTNNFSFDAQNRRIRIFESDLGAVSYYAIVKRKSHPYP
jgi:hypothetical protein